MQGPVTWRQLIFIAGIILGTVAWTWWFWDLIDGRIEHRIDVEWKHE